MKVVQSDSVHAPHITLAQVAVGEPFRHVNSRGDAIYMRIMPAYLTNGRDLHVVHIQTGRSYAWSPVTAIVPVNAFVQSNGDVSPTTFHD